ncbi:hypothetical protein H0O03_02205, partial [Candidatus Micrarchaeota archaeon]|nr:hypothetical protein [Candidatus Micrarchaeota archaeon]
MVLPRAVIELDWPLKQSIAQANKELAKKEWTPHNPSGVDANSLRRLHDLAPYAYIHVASLPAERLKQLIASQDALSRYVKQDVYGGSSKKTALSTEGFEFDQRVIGNERVR